MKSHLSHTRSLVRMEIVNTPTAARNVLLKAGVEHYWDMLEKFVPAIQD